MGLDCSHGAFNGSYGGFNRLRQYIAKAIGGNYPPHEDKELDDESFYYSDTWDVDKHKGIHLLLSHSDCDGIFTPKECNIVAEDFRDNLNLFIEQQEVIEFPLIKLVDKFIEGCENAYINNEDLEFL